ncbi:single-stranded-DNA-specific exonuclease RecJ [Uliginosibacterium sp. sgz301328]|uniref:single-stranded-DNA-specific exonuclease RecJ n=1 Tax=Uliginosibacterium sp. sgz301328 TaxID=3243764 RepID=UPI00359ED6A7
MTIIIRRNVPQRMAQILVDGGQHPLLARLYAARGVASAMELGGDLAGLLAPTGLRGIDEAARILADAIESGARMLIVADYDCDGATACAVGIRALRAMGGEVDYLVPNRFEYGYGLTPAIVELAASKRPDVLITVDNGIASVDGVAAARAAGMRTVITDHHLPGDSLPDADVIVNPNHPACNFASKHLAGVGVMFYVASAVRTELRSRGWFAATGRSEPKLGELLDLVALGTVADVVRLDANNRLLVAQGIARMRAGRMQPGVRALFVAAGRDPVRASTFDMGFALGPRLNAAGRLSDMSLGIECLVTDDLARAMNLAQELDRLNRERRNIEEEMRDTALATLEFTDIAERAAIALFEPDWHQGVIGIVAGRVKERAHRPTIAFARAGEDGTIKGSGRSIPALHMRDALDLISKRHPQLILKFGGHAMAAGLTIREGDFSFFADTFAGTVGELLSESDLMRRIETDGPLESGYMSLEVARLLDRAIWGQGFAPPLFDDVFDVENQRLLKERHLKLRLRKGNASFDAVRFHCAEVAPDRIRAAYRLAVNEYNGVSSVQLMLEHFEPA